MEIPNYDSDIKNKKKIIINNFIHLCQMILLEC